MFIRLEKKGFTKRQMVSYRIRDMFRPVELYLVQEYNALELLDMLFCYLFELFDVYIDEVDLDEDDKGKFETTKSKGFQ